MSASGETGDSNWWKRRSLKLRIAVCFTVIASVIMLGLLPVVYILIERRLHLEMDHQLGIDWALVEAHLEKDDTGGIHWRTGSPATPKSAGYAETWFDVWSNGEVLLSHWPEQRAQVLHPPQPAQNPAPAFYNIVLDPEFPARTLQKSVEIGGRNVILRVFRNESGIQATLRQILIGLALGMPVAVLLAALGGYLMAGRTLKPISEMADQAREITSESLGKRLPNPNPYDELGQLATVFNATLHRLENSFEALKRFTADASHELRTPLTALRSVGEIALRDAGDVETLRETIGSMLEEAQRLSDLTDTLLMLARVESGRLPLHRESVPLTELVSDVCDSLEVLATEKQQRIELTTAPALIVRADQVLLRQAVMNILHNAIRYSPPDSTLRVACFKSGNDAVVEISDDGPGIALEHQNKVFERFYRVDKARSRAEGGAGLGLALAKLFVEQNGGDIGLSSDPDQGCRFRIEIPLPDDAVS